MPSTRLLTLTGAGGVGKTRLALQLASRAGGRYAGGVCLVELASIANAALVPSAISAALGLAEDRVQSPSDALLARLREREILLVLDNCEHLIDACARLVDALLRSCPGISLIATSREPLGIPGEVIWVVPSLATPPATSPGTAGRPAADDLLGYDSVRLFIERSRAALPSFALTPQNADAVAETCRQLDGIPLALELAAARVRALTVEQIARHLQDRFRLLNTGARTADRRHQTLRSLVDWSYELLSHPEQVLFRRLSVFAGGWTLDAAEAICSGEPIQAEQILELLSLLVDKSLVIAEPAGGEERYDLYETLRQYGAEKLEQSGDAALVRQRHLEWFRDLAESLGARIQSSEGVTVLGRLEAELANIRAGIDWSHSVGSSVLDGLRLAAAPLMFWFMCGHAREGEQCLGALLELLPQAIVESSDDSTLLYARAAALTTLGFVYRREGRADLAVPVITESLELWRQLGDQRRVAFTLRELGRGRAQAGDLEGGRALMEESLTLARKLGVRPLIYEALLSLGVTLRQQGKYDRAQALFEESLELGRQQGDQRRVALSTLNLGALALEQGRDDSARRCLRESLAVSQRAGVKVGFAPAFALLAQLAAREPQPLRAIRLFAAAAAARDALGADENESLQAQDETLRSLELARQAVGAGTAAAAWNDGLSLTLTEAVGLALEDGSAAGAAEAGARGGPLTPREREVTELVARGLTNRQIATELVIAEGTAKRHVENILSRLGLASRSQLAAWLAASESARGSTSSP